MTGWDRALAGPPGLATDTAADLERARAAIAAVHALCQDREDSEKETAQQRGYRAPRQYAQESTLVSTRQIRQAIDAALNPAGDAP